MNMNSSYTSPRTKPLFRSIQIIRAITGFLEALLAFRFILKLLGANPTAGFSSFIYKVSYPFAVPFLNVFRITQVRGSVFEWTTLLAMIVYWLIAWGIIKLLLMGKSVTTSEAAERLDEEDK
ncbi:MAG TPA: YggT family protein [Bacillota bacterium]|nr:YggT family protein [Bacillota bacterium]